MIISQNSPTLLGTATSWVRHYYPDAGAAIRDATIGVVNAWFKESHLNDLVADLRTGQYGLTDLQVEILLVETEKLSPMLASFIPPGFERINRDVIVKYFVLAIFKNIIVNYRNQNPGIRDQELVGKAFAYALDKIASALDRQEAAQFDNLGNCVPAPEVLSAVLDLVFPEKGANFLFEGERAFLHLFVKPFLPPLVTKFLQDYVITKNQLEDVRVYPDGQAASSCSISDSFVNLVSQSLTGALPQSPSFIDPDRVIDSILGSFENLPAEPVATFSSSPSPINPDRVTDSILGSFENLPAESVVAPSSGAASSSSPSKSLTMSQFLQSCDIFTFKPQINNTVISEEVIQTADALLQSIMAKALNEEEGGLGAQLMPMLLPLLPGSPFPEDLGSATREFYQELTSQILRNISAKGSPAVFRYIENKLKPMLILLLQGFLNEGKRLREEEQRQSQEPLPELSDKVLMLMGGYSVLFFVMEKLTTENFTIEEKVGALKARFPAFAAIHLPPKQQEIFLNFLQEYLKVIFPVRKNLEQSMRMEQGLDLALGDVFGYLGDRNNTPSIINAPIEILCSFLKTTLENGHTQVDFAHAERSLNEYGFNVTRDDLSNVMAIVTGSNAQAFNDSRDSVLIFVRIAIKMLIWRVGRIARNNPQAIMDLIQRTLLTLGQHMAARQGGAPGEDQGAVELPLYADFVNSVLEICGFTDERSLDFCPEIIRGQLWELMRSHRIPSALQQAFHSVFDAHALRKMMLDAMRKMSEEPVLAQEVVLPAEMEAAFNRPTEAVIEVPENVTDAIGQVFAVIVDFLRVPFLKGNLNQDGFKRKWGQRLSNIVFRSISKQFPQGITGNPLLQLITTTMYRTVPTLGVQIDTGPVEEQSAIERRVAAAENAVGIANAKYQGNVRKQVLLSWQLNATPKHARGEIEVKLAALLRLGEAYFRERRHAIAQKNIVMNELKVVQEIEIVESLKRLPRILVSRTIKANWENAKDRIQTKAEALFGRLYPAINRGYRSICSILSAFAALLQLPFVGSYLSNRFWLLVENYLATLGGSINTFLGDETKLKELQRIILRIPIQDYLQGQLVLNGPVVSS